MTGNFFVNGYRVPFQQMHTDRKLDLSQRSLDSRPDFLYNDSFSFVFLVFFMIHKRAKLVGFSVV